MKIDWNNALEPLLKEYGKRKHPLEYNSRYQIMVMVILSAQTSDRNVNALATRFFEAYPTLEHLALAQPEQLHPITKSITSFVKKSAWLVEIAQTVKRDENIPRTMEGLTKLPGISRKSANVIIRESGDNAEGIIVDLHVIRVTPRLGIAEGENPLKIEKQLIALIPQNRWNEAGMAFSFLGREVCRPTNPKCNICVLNPNCQYYKSFIRG